MLKDIDIVKIPFEFNGEERYLRYNMNSRLYLEYMCEKPDILKKDTKYWTYDDLFHLFRAMLMDSFYNSQMRKIHMFYKNLNHNLNFLIYLESQKSGHVF